MSRRRRRSRTSPVAASVTTNGHDAAPAPVSIPEQPAPLLIREPETEDDLQALHVLLMMQGQEMASAPVDPQKVFEKLVRACAEPERHAMLMAVRGGRLIGCLCLERVSYWYSDSSFLADFSFYVLPRHRNEDVGPALLQEARLIADRLALPIFIHINNPSRRRGGQTGIERAASLIGYVPSGAVLALRSAEMTRVN